MNALESSQWDLKELLPTISVSALSILGKKIDEHYPNKEQYPYHNKEHPFDVLDLVIQIANRCEKEGIVFDRTVLVLAALLHDLGYHLDPKNFNKEEIKTREDVAAYLTEKILTELGVEKEIINKVISAILGTHTDGKLDTVEAKILRAADLASISGPYESVRNGTERLWKEFCHEQNAELPFDKFALGAINHLAKYFSVVIELTPSCRDDEKKSIWHVGAAANMFSLFREVSTNNEKIVGFIGEDAFKIAYERASVAQNKDLYVLFGKESELDLSLSYGEKVIKTQEKTFTVLPWTHHSPSAPETSFDELLIEYRGSIELPQYKKLIKDEGILKVFISDAMKELDVWGCELTESRIEYIMNQKADLKIIQEGKNPGVWYEFIIDNKPKTLME